MAIDPSTTRDDLATPGHIFPLLAHDGGVLVRAGHTEAAVDVARMAGLKPAGVICEVMNDDGTMARLPDLVSFAQYHGLRIGTIADLIAYRRRAESLVERRVQSTIDSRHGGEWQLRVYVNRASYAEHVALFKGNPTGPEPLLVRMHALNVLDDVLGDRTGGRAGDLPSAMELIAREGRGVVVLIREPRATSLTEHLGARLGTDPGTHLRDYGVGAQILLDLGVRDMILLSNSQRTVVGLEGYGLRIVEQRPIPRHDDLAAGST